MTHRLPDPHGRFTALDRLRFVGRRGLDWVVTIAESFMDRSADLIPLAQRSTRFLAAVAVTAWGAAMRLLRRTLNWPGWLRLRHALSRCVPVFSTVSNVFRQRSVITCAMVAALSLPLAGSVSAFSGGTQAGTAGDGSAPVGQRRGTSLDVSGHDAESGKGAKSKKQQPTPDPSAPNADPSPVVPSPTISPVPSAIIATQPALTRPLTNLGTAKVALTFDDGPDAATPDILAMLRKHGVKATFCVIGVSVRDHHDLIREMVADGHTLCNHTWAHNLYLGKRSAAVIRADLQRTSDEIHLAAPDVPIKYFRHPGGNFTPTAISVASELGMTSIGWQVDPRDWDVETYGTGTAMSEHIVNAVTKYTHPGSIILSHDGGGQRSGTVIAYRTLLPWLLDRHDLIALPV